MMTDRWIYHYSSKFLTK